MKPNRSYRFWHAATQGFLDSIALALLTLVCFQLRLNLATTVCLYMIVIVVVSLQGSFVSSAVVSLIAVGCLAYYFSPPIFSFRVSDPFDDSAITAFLITSAVITHLVSRVRIREEKLVLANSKLDAQIAEQKLAEDALHQAQTELAHVSRVTTMGELTASIAHEIKQPLAAVITNGNACLRWLARETPDLDEAREAVRRVIRDGNRANEVITRIRALLRKTETRKTQLDINEAIEEVILLTQKDAARRGVRLRLELTAGLPPVFGDRVQLQQVALNLVMNGVEAMALVNDRPRELLISSSQDGTEQLLVAVQDCGMGIDQENLEKIFQAFYTTKSQGMGMGLAISRSIIEAHGGRLWATPNEGEGATIQFTLPLNT